MEKFQIDFINYVRNDSVLRQFVPSDDVLLYIACQFALESNFGNSDLVANQSNYCGMKRPSKRLFYGSLSAFDKNFEFATYDCFDSCVIDYIAWLLYKRPPQNVFKSVDNFVMFLFQSGYCPEKDYIDKINKIYYQFKSLKS